jgi:hypothetical protein
MADDTDYRRHFLLAIGAVMAIIVGVEAAARYALPRMSRIDGRVEAEKKELRLHGSQFDVVLLGNSLLLAAVDMDQLQGLVGNRITVRRFAVEDTSYVDWALAIERIVEEGAPREVLLMLSPEQLRMTHTRGAYSAYYMLSPGGSLKAARWTSMDNTEASGMLASHYSAYYGKRAEIRKLALDRVLPGSATILQSLALQKRKGPRQGELPNELLLARLAQLHETCTDHGIRCHLIPPPLLDQQAQTESMLEMARAAGMADTTSLAMNGWTDPEFSPDKFHMSPAGAQRFTGMLATFIGSKRVP